MDRAPRRRTAPWILSVLLLPALAVAGLGSSGVLSIESDRGAIQLQWNAQPAAVPAPVPTQLVVLQPDDPSTLDPILTTAGPSLAVIANLYETLTTWDDERRLQPALAASWEQLDPLTWRFYLRPAVRFHDGAPLTAEDVRFSLERARREGRPPISAGLETVERLSALDERTVEIATAEPDPLLPARLAQPGAEIVPAQYVAARGPELLAVRPIGTGPYRFVSWEPGERLVIEANPDHWAGRPAIDRVVWRPLPDHATRLAVVEAGEADVATALPPGLWPASGSPVQVVSAPGASAVLLLVNATEGPLADRRVRQALQHAIDLDALVQELTAGQGQRLAGALPSTDFGHAAGSSARSDEAEARRLLAAAGHAAGLTVRLIVGGRVVPNEAALAEALARDWSRVGVKAEIVGLNVHAYRRLVAERALPAGSLLLLGMPSTLYDADGSLWRLLRPTGLGGAAWAGGWPGQPFHDLMVAARRSADPAARLTAYAAALRLLAEERPVIELFQPPVRFAVGPRVRLTPRSDGRLLGARVALEPSASAAETARALQRD